MAANHFAILQIEHFTNRTNKWASCRREDRKQLESLKWFSVIVSLGIIARVSKICSEYQYHTNTDIQEWEMLVFFKCNIPEWEENLYFFPVLKMGGRILKEKLCQMSL